MKRADARRFLLVLVGVMICSTVLLVFRCTMDINELDMPIVPLSHSAPVPERLTANDDTLKLSLQLAKEIRTANAEEKMRLNMTSSHQSVTCTDCVNHQVDVLDFMQRAATSLVDPVFYSNEFEVVPFTRFTLDRLYPVDPGLGRRVIEKPIGYRKREIRTVIEYTVNRLTQRTGQNYSASDFLEGICRAVPGIGTQYELYFRDRKQYRKVVVALPNLSPFVVGDETVPVHRDIVHVIVALSQRVDTFQQFLKRFEQLAARDNSVELTVVYFGNVGLKQVQTLVREFNSNQNSDKVHLLMTSEKFSRGRGLQIGADSLQNNSLLFMCDVDIVVTSSFLERCRLHASQGRSVYYPIIFSLYNPAITSQLQDKKTSPSKPLITRDAGFWRDFGYGMTCQYRADFLTVGGFTDDIDSNQSASGWGLEDVRLYRKHLNSGNVTVVRATDPGIFHIWHEKTCPRSLPKDQYKGCLRSRALSEASHAQLGMLLLRRTQTTP